jgi:hypothetical protein
MAVEDFYIDKDGHFILLGLSLEETAEFFRLNEVPDGLISERTTWTFAEELRWFELFDKHEAALQLALAVPKTPQ